MATHDKDLARLARQLDELPGWRVEDRKKGWIVFPPQGTPFKIPHGPTQPYRAIRNARAKARRLGADI